MYSAILVRLRLSGVLADHVELRHLAVLHRFEHLREVTSFDARNGPARDAPGMLEAGADGGIFDVLEAGKLVRDRAHVAATLHVVLAAQRVESRSIPADVAGEQGEGDQSEGVVDC